MKIRAIIKETVERTRIIEFSTNKNEPVSLQSMKHYLEKDYQNVFTGGERIISAEFDGGTVREK